MVAKRKKRGTKRAWQGITYPKTSDISSKATKAVDSVIGSPPSAVKARSSNALKLSPQPRAPKKRGR